MEIKMFGHYYRMFKGTGGIPTKVTVVGIEGDIVTLVRGHLTKEDFEERSEDLDEAIKLFCLTKMKCNKNKMLTSLTPKQQKLIEKQDREIERMVMQLGCALERFKNGEDGIMKGTVKWFNTQKGYGFITSEDGMEIFVHQSNILMDGFRYLDDGDFVKFDMEENERGFQAINVTPVLTLKMMKEKAEKEGLYLKEAKKDGYGQKRWLIVSQNNIVQSGEHGMLLEELNRYFSE